MHTQSAGTTPDLAPDARPILRETDTNGFELVAVPVHGAGYARLDGPTADMLQAAGLSFTGWHLHANGNVCAPSRNPERFPTLVVARLIVGASPNQHVCYRNSDRLDLTRINLRAALRMKAGMLLTPREPS